ncbi:MAG: type I methionyl aminopeptidase [Propionibacteriaceae bacterium]|jgi:methionyl aminopeptidase|nr:type I methionyl aminopeptidase [Propionibacteriaceae bacterium]
MLRRSTSQLKTEDQLRTMRASGLIVSRILDELARRCKPGTTPRELDALAQELLARAGATSSFLGYGGQSGLPPFPAVTCISVNDQVVHGIPDDRPFVAGDLVSIDFGAEYQGWHGDSARTVAVGEVGAAAAALSTDTRRALWDGIAAVRAGRRIGDVSAAIESALRIRRKGYGIVREFTGHGIGTQMHMEPDVPNYGRAGKGPRIVQGMCLAIEPIITLGSPATSTLDDEWTVVTRDHSLAAHWEHTVAVTPRGLWVLTAEDGGEAELTARGVSFGPLG